MPEAVTRIEIDGETHLAIEDLAGLLSLVQIGVLEIHPWGSTIDKLEQPDRITFDLDPDVGLAWSRVTEAALEIRDVLAGLGLQSFAKTTGGKGLHVVVPLTPRLDWEEVKNFTKAVAEHMAARHPQRYTANQSKRARQGRIYIDYLRNARGATAVGAYSTRARPGAPVSTPLSWSEVESRRPPGNFTVATVPARLASPQIGSLGRNRQARARRSAPPPGASSGCEAIIPRGRVKRQILQSVEAVTLQRGAAKMITSKITSKAQTTIPQPVRAALQAEQGDELGYRIEGDHVVLSKVRAQFDRRSVRDLYEWSSEADERAYGDL